MAADGFDGLDVDILSGGDPEAALAEIVRRLNATAEPDVDLIAVIGVGPLESLFHQGHEERLWPQIEELARRDVRFRRALARAWAFQSPMYERRDALLEELGAPKARRNSGGTEI